jgi:hypothetical protein
VDIIVREVVTLINRLYQVVRDFLKAAEKVWGESWGNGNYMITALTNAADAINARRLFAVGCIAGAASNAAITIAPTGAVIIAGPLPITGGSGSPCRALALVERS